MVFWPNLELPDLAEHGQGLPQDPPTIPNKPFQWATHKNKNRLPACCGLPVLLAWLTINKTNIFFFPYFMSYTAEVVFLTINSHHCNNPTVSKDVIFFVIKMFRNVQKFSFKTACGSPCSEQIGSLIQHAMPLLEGRILCLRIQATRSGSLSSNIH